ncbi:hypothetical protein [Halorubrum ezzemoulense]|uniref:hypothetical protein n=1 Tax=Halorubrum ezzemoulense TaxID=337243 RepID=UPI00232EB108|nr:hypothetical protein [Halorubrum ezzemoulense]MDB2243022.1 hypothetical protein [Halorubrum ezzemoulense]
MTEDSDNPNWPTPGPNEPVPSWPKYRQLRDAIHDYLDHEPDDPTWSDIWRAVGSIMGEYQRDAFAQAFDLDKPAEQACIRRLITGDEKCPHSPLEADSDPTGPPHSPPADDHPTLWLGNESGEPAVYSIHLYPGNVERLDSQKPPHNLWFEIFEFAAEWGLEVSILPKSWYNLGSTVQVIFYPPERYR